MAAQVEFCLPLNAFLTFGLNLQTFITSLLSTTSNSSKLKSQGVKI